jgi:agmatinase
MSLTELSFAGYETFLYSDKCPDLDRIDADIAFLGIPFGQSYSFAEIASEQSRMPRAMRAATPQILRSIERYDFDLGGPLYDNKPIRAVDCGDIIGDHLDPSSHAPRAETAVRKIIKAGAMPIVLGGDHGVPIPVFRALDSLGPITLIHVDQHLDWRNEVNGVREGLSSPIRRASEMNHIKGIFQIGLNAAGSARQEEVDAALAYGSNLVTAFEVHDEGMEAVLERIPNGGNYYITLDLDGMNAGIAPGVFAPCPSGLHLYQVRKLIHGLVAKGRVVGMDVVEIVPSMDVNQVTCITAGRLLVNLIGAAVRAGYFKGRAK